MRRFMLVLIGLLLICSFCLAEEDAVSSATLKIDRLPKIESQDSRILIFPRTTRYARRLIP